MLSELSGLELVHAVARRLFTDTDERLDYLTMDDAERVAVVQDRLSTLLAYRPALADA